MSNCLVRCPFHLKRIGKDDGYEPSRWSCNVDLEQGVFYCHGCGAKGRLSHHPELIALAQGAESTEWDSTPVIPTEVVIPPLTGYPKEYLISRGFSLEILHEFGVGGNTDRFYIPVKLRSGKLLGLITRSNLDGERTYKYSNGLKKSKFLFGSHKFVEAGDTVVVVEGSLDCIKMHQLGLRNTVAALGDHLTSTQMDLLKKLGHNVILAFDNDPAGIEATIVTGKELQKRGHNVLKMMYPGKDPGELQRLDDASVITFLEFLFKRQVIDVLKSRLESNIIK